MGYFETVLKSFDGIQTPRARIWICRQCSSRYEVERGSLLSLIRFWRMAKEHYEYHRQEDPLEVKE